MTNKEFNLSVLENITTFDTPLKECFDYMTILSLIKEEVDIDPSEDESEYQKIDKISTPLKGTKRKRLNTLESVFKSPYKKKCCLKLKSPGSLSIDKNEKNIDNVELDKNGKINRGRSLGALRPKRSSLANQRNVRRSVSHSETSTYSDNADDNLSVKPKKKLKNRQNIVQLNGIEFKNVCNVEEPVVDSSYADDEISISSKGESTSLATTDPLDIETANDSFVESSQSTQTSSELRQRLNRRRSEIEAKIPSTDVVKDNISNIRIKLEDENEHFSLALSPCSNSSASTYKIESSPPRTINRKSICRSSPVKSGTRENCDNSVEKIVSTRQRRRKISAGSPLKGLTQELENCIKNGDYVEMCDSETETMSFTFETIQLLNDYEECNQQANNKILDKILSSPTRKSEEEILTIVDDLLTPNTEQFNQDPLHIDYENEKILASTSKKKESAKRKLNRRKNIENRGDKDHRNIDLGETIEIISSPKKKRKIQEEKVESVLNEKSVNIDDCERIKKISSASATKRGSRGEKNGSGDSEIDRESLIIDDSDTTENNSLKSTAKNRRSRRKVKGFGESQTDEISQNIDDNYEIEDDSLESTEFDKMISKKNLPVRNCRKSRSEEFNQNSQYIDDSDTNEDFSSISGDKKKKEREEKKNKEKSSEFGNEKNVKNAIKNVTSTPKKKSDNEAEESTEISVDEESPNSEDNNEIQDFESESEMPVTKSIKDRRRSSEKFEINKVDKANLSYWKSVEGLAVEAAKISKKIAAAKKKNAVPDEIYQKMLELSVKLRHVAPPQHDIKDGLSVLTAQEEKVFLKHAPLSKGKYSTAEDEIIMKNWNDFCEDHDWDRENYKPFLSLKHGTKLIMSCSEERKKFVQFLANGLPNRPLFSVYKRFRRLFDNRYDRYKRYKAKEDAKIIAYTICNSPEPKDERFAELSHIMRRSNTSLWKRNKTLKEQGNRVSTTVEWNLRLVEKFLKNLLDVTLSDELIDLKDAHFPRFIWQKMERKMEIKYDILQKYWEEKLHVQLFAPGPILMNEIKIKLIEYMHMKEVKNSRDIKWDDVAKYFDGYTITFLRYIFNMLIVKISKKLKSRGFSAMVEFLHSKKIEYLIEKSKDKCLPRISYRDKKAEFVVENIGN